jgi:hypothetical protein
MLADRAVSPKGENLDEARLHGHRQASLFQCPTAQPAEGAHSVYAFDVLVHRGATNVVEVKLECGL